MMLASTKSMQRARSAHTTDDEMRFVRRLSDEALDGYIKAWPMRQNWGAIDKMAVARLMQERRSAPHTT